MNTKKIILNILKFILLFIFGIICFLVIEECYYDYIYSEDEVLFRLSEEFDDDSEDYVAFFDYANTLNNHLNWDSLELNENEIGYEPNQKSKLHFFLSAPDESGFSFDRKEGCTVYLSRRSNDYQENEIEKMLERRIGLSISQFDSLIVYLERIDEYNFSIYKDGSVVIEKFIGRGLYDMDIYQLVRVGDKMFLYGNYQRMPFENIFIGKKN